VVVGVSQQGQCVVVTAVLTVPLSGDVMLRVSLYAMLAGCITSYTTGTGPFLSRKITSSPETER